MGNIVVLCAVIVGMAYMGADVFGTNGWSKAAVVLVFALWTAGIMASSMVVSVKQLEHIKIRKVIDGQEKMFVTLKLGSFGYTIEVPEEVKKEE